MRKLIVLSVICLAAGFLGAEEKPGVQAEKPKPSYCASAKSDKYHRPKCEWAKKINPANLIWFVSHKEASEKGYRPCAVCKP